MKMRIMIAEDEYLAKEELIYMLDKEKDIETVNGMELRFSMPSALCSYCLGETRIGESYQMGNVRKIDLGEVDE